MADHRTPHGEESTYRANGGQQTFPYEGKHRTGKAVKALIDTHTSTPKGDIIPAATVASRLRLRSKKK